MTTFLDALREGTGSNLTRTENGAVTYKSSLDACVDFFSLAGAMRANPKGAADLFEKAYYADPQLAVRTMFYLRDIRGGQGERDVFRACLQRLFELSPVPHLLQFIPEYGRWDDLFALDLDDHIVSLIAQQLKIDLLDYQASPDQPVSLMAKWLPSENATSPKTKRLARQLRTALGYTPAEYRRTLSKLRKRIHLLEQFMSTNKWNNIEYGKLPSQAHRKHVKAFRRHTNDRYQKYLDSVAKGEAKINVSTVYPYEIYKMVDSGDSKYADVAWENLPDFTNGTNALVMADVSGSMFRPYQSANPIAVSVSLALYFAERNTGAFNGYFMTFSSDPALVKVQGRTLTQKMRNIEKANWAMSTDLSKAFRKILAAAVAANEPPPAVLYVISDMEFNAASSGRSSQNTVFNTAKREFNEKGFELPHVVFWNVAARNMQSPALANDGHVSLVSGCSPAVFGMAVQNKNPLQLVQDVVNGERYARITL